MDETEIHERAMAAYRAHTGRDHAPAGSPYDPPSMQDLNRLTVDGTYGASWCRPGLDMRTKSFISLTITASLGTGDQFKAHIRAAHHIGITKDEIVEFLIHLNGYLGTPRTSSARGWAREVWKEMAEAGKSGT